MVPFCSVRSLSSVRFLFLSVSSLFILLVHSPPSRAGVKSLFIRGKGAGPHYGCAWGRAAPGWVGGRGWQGAEPLISHHQGAWGFGSFAGHMTRRR